MWLFNFAIQHKWIAFGEQQAESYWLTISLDKWLIYDSSVAVFNYKNIN
jgi:hypothetical protein